MHPLVRLARAAQKKTRLDTRRQQELENDIHAVAGLLSEMANEQLIATVRGVERYRDMKALHRALQKAFTGTPFEAAVKAAHPGDIAGAWEARSGSILVNGGEHFGARLGGLWLAPRYFLAHEMGEALDASGQWSAQEAWQVAWRVEMMDHTQLRRWAEQAEWLRHRAQVSAHEGFCEFLAIAALLSGGMQRMKALFPLCYDFWWEHSLLATAPEDTL